MGQGVRIGDNVQIGSNTRLGDWVIVAPGVVIGSFVAIGNHVTLGIGCLVGDYCVVGDYSKLIGTAVQANVFIGRQNELSDILIGLFTTIGMGNTAGGDRTSRRRRSTDERESKIGPNSIIGENNQMCRGFQSGARLHMGNQNVFSCQSKTVVGERVSIGDRNAFYKDMIVEDDVCVGNDNTVEGKITLQRGTIVHNNTKFHVDTIVSPNATVTDKAEIWTTKFPQEGGSLSPTVVVALGVTGGLIAIIVIAGLVFLRVRKQRPRQIADFSVHNESVVGIIHGKSHGAALGNMADPSASTCATPRRRKPDGDNLEHGSIIDLDRAQSDRTDPQSDRADQTLAQLVASSQHVDLWDSEQVRVWALKGPSALARYARLLEEAGVTGAELVDLDTADMPLTMAAWGIACQDRPLVQRCIEQLQALAANQNSST